MGDSTQTDPEAYGEIARRWPGWIKAIWIRKVVDVAEMEGTDKNSEKRFEEAFQGVDRGVWRTFEKDPVAELGGEVERLKTL